MTPLVTPLISGAARSREADLQQLQLAGLATCKAGGQGPVAGSRVVNTGLPLVVPPKKRLKYSISTMLKMFFFHIMSYNFQVFPLLYHVISIFGVAKDMIFLVLEACLRLAIAAYLYYSYIMSTLD